MTTDFAILLEAAFYKYLTLERGCSSNTVSNYMDTFISLLNYLDTEKNIKPFKVKMDIFDFNLINGFLDWLETEKKSLFRQGTTVWRGSSHFSNTSATMNLPT